jgi:cephalosporin hydroxylase
MDRLQALDARRSTIRLMRRVLRTLRARASELAASDLSEGAPTASRGEPTFISADNRPAPLRNPPSPLFADTVHQMSFGERAALEGLLVDLRPRVSIEIGTYEGGSLMRIASHSQHVDTFDLDDLVSHKDRLGNVTFYHGDSRVQLSLVLDRYAARGVTIDFVLIDGDHSPEGVRADLMNVLQSPACGRTVIVLHDTMNTGVRQGIESAGLATNPRVVYVELDLVAGYEFSGGDFDGQRWGGLGLVVTGDRATDGYGARPVQTRYVPAFDLMHRNQ